MLVDTKNLVSISEANQNFSKVARLVDKNGSAVILKNNNPKYVILEYSRFKEEETALSNKIEDIGKNIINRNLKAFKELAK